MRNVKFILSAIAILLTGAIAAGLAARAVTAPDGEGVRSAGTVSIPAVLGQTAEEVLFYPWSLYDTEALSHIPENYLTDFFHLSPEEPALSDFETIGDLRDFYGETCNDMSAAMFLFPFELPAGPVKCDIPALLRALEWNLTANDRAPAGGEHYYLADFPAVLREGEVPVTLSMALSVAGSRGDYSFLIRPAKPAELTEEDRQAALARVKEELLELLLNAPYFNYELTDEELYHLWLVKPDEIAPDAAEGMPAESGGAGITATRPDEGSALGRMLRDYLRPDGGYIPMRAALELQSFFTTTSDDYVRALYGKEPTLDDVLDALPELGISVQIITTQDQIVVLFAQSAGIILGLYYDVQLGRWSGVGWRADL